jgi:hypothetical protein
MTLSLCFSLFYASTKTSPGPYTFFLTFSRIEKLITLQVFAQYLPCVVIFVSPLYVFLREIT